MFFAAAEPDADRGERITLPMPGWSVALLITGFVLLDLIIVLAVFNTMRNGWRAFASKHPSVVPGLVEQRRARQGIALGLFNLGMCFTIERDALYVHLQPNAFGKLAGVTAVSLPFAEMRGFRKLIFGMCEVKLGKDPISVPRWCVADLAQAGSST